MTLGTLVQILMALLAVLLTVEARAHGRRRAATPTPPPPISFEAWRIVRWDDECAAPHLAPCDRGPIAAQRTARNQRRTRRLPIAAP